MVAVFALAFSLSLTVTTLLIHYRLAVQHVLILFIGLMAHFFASEELSFQVNCCIAGFYLVSTLIFLIIAMLLNQKRYKAASKWSTAWRLLYPFSGLENVSKYIQTEELLEQGMTREAKVILREIVNAKVYNSRVAEMNFYLLERDYTWFISEISKKDLLWLRVAIPNLIKTYGEIGQHDQLIEAVKPYIDSIAFMSYADRQSLLLLAVYTGHQAMYDFATKKLVKPLTSFEKHYLQSTLDFHASGDKEAYLKAFNNAPPPLTSWDKVDFENWQDRIKSTNLIMPLGGGNRQKITTLWERVEKVNNFIWGNYRQTPWAGIAFACITILLYMMAPEHSSQLPQAELRIGALVYPYSIDVSQWWRFVSAGFAQTDAVYFYISLLCLLYGVWLERAIGSKAFISIFLTSGVGAYLITFLIFPLIESHVAPFTLLGAFPSLMGIFAVILAYSLKTWLEDKRFYIALCVIPLTLINIYALFLMDSYYHHASALLHTLGLGIGFLFFMVVDLCSKAGRKTIKAKSLLIAIVMSVVAVSLFYSIKQEKQWKQTAYRYQLSAGLCNTLGKSKDAAYWHQKSNQLVKSDPEQQGELGFNYLYGKGLSKNEAKGLYFLEQSALRGSRPSVAALSDYYWREKETPRDVNKGFYWSKKAAEANIGFAQKRVADAYFHGGGTGKDLKQAYDWYSRALKSPDAEFLDQFEIKATMRTIKAKLKE